MRIKSLTSFISCLLLLPSVLPAQDEPTQTRVLNQFDALEKALAQVPTVLPAGSRLLPRLEAYVTVFPKGPQSQLAINITNQILKTKPDELSDLESRSIAFLIDHVKKSRGEGQVEDMLSYLLLLDSLLPTDVRIQAWLAEAYGTASALFDHTRAGNHLQRVLLQLTPADGTDADQENRALQQLREFAPGFVAARLSLEEARQSLHQKLSTLSRQKPFQVWEQRDPSLEPHREALANAIHDGNQTAMKEALSAMLKLTPEDPVVHLMLGRLHASLGPQYKVATAINHLEKFLQLTTEEHFDIKPNANPILNRDELAIRLRNMELMQPKDDLDSLRRESQKLIATLRKNPNPRHASLAYPDKGRMKTDLVQQLSDLGESQATHTENADRIQELSREMQSLEDQYEDWRRRPARRKGVSDPQPWVDAIASRRNTIDSLKKKQITLETQMQLLESRINEMRERLSSWK